MHLSLVAAVVVATALSVTAAPDHKCCVDQPAPRIVVEKKGTQTKYRHATASSRYSTKCGTWGWRRCTRYRAYTVSQSYRVDVYAQRSIPQPCRRYACCNGYVMIKDVCYANHELEAVASHTADIKDSLADIGNVDLKDVIGTIHDIVG